MSTCLGQNTRMATRNRNMDQQYSRPFFGHLMSIENLRPLNRRCDIQTASSFLPYASNKLHPSQPLRAPSPGICNHCRVPINNNYSPAINGLSRTNLGTFSSNNNNYYSNNNYNRNNNNNDNGNNNCQAEATNSNSSLSIRKQCSENRIERNHNANQQQQSNCSDNTRQNNLVANNNYNQNTIKIKSDCGNQPPLIFPNFRPIVEHSPRCGWPMKPFNLGAYPVLPGQSRNDPPCFSQTIQHRPSPIVLPSNDSYTVGRQLKNHNATPVPYCSSLGALGDCCTSGRSSNTQFKSHQHVPLASNPSCCGDDEYSHRT